MADWFPPFWASQAVTIEYSQPGAYVSGSWVAGTTSQVQITGVILDMPLAEIAQLGYGEEQEQVVTVYLRSSEFEAYKGFIKNGMKVISKGKAYKVLQYTERNKLLPHYKLIAQRDDNEAS